MANPRPLILLFCLMPILAACGHASATNAQRTAISPPSSADAPASSNPSASTTAAPSGNWPGPVASVMATLHAKTQVPLMAPTQLPQGEATGTAEPTASGFLVTLQSGTNSVGSFGGLHTPSTTAAADAVYSESSFQSPNGAPTSQIVVGNNIHAKFYGSSDSLIWNSGDWTCEVVGSSTPATIATPIASYLANHPLPFSSGVLTVIVGTSSNTTTLAWNNGANVYTVSQTGTSLQAIQTAAAMVPYPSP